MSVRTLRLRLDLIYIENYSFLLDVKLTQMTFRIMLSKESAESFETVEELKALEKGVLEQIGKKPKKERKRGSPCLGTGKGAVYGKQTGISDQLFGSL